MNGAYTPGLMKKMTHPITKKYKSCALRKMEQDVKVVGNNRVDNVLMTNGDNKKQEGIIIDQTRNRTLYPTVTSADSTGIKETYKNYKSSPKENLNKLRGYAKKYGLDAVKGVRDHYGFGPNN